MILAIDIGNTNIVIGCIKDDKILFTERMSTDSNETVLEYAIGFKTVLELYHIHTKDVKEDITVIFRLFRHITGFCRSFPADVGKQASPFQPPIDTHRFSRRFSHYKKDPRRRTPPRVLSAALDGELRSRAEKSAPLRGSEKNHHSLDVEVVHRKKALFDLLFFQGAVEEGQHIHIQPVP